MNDVNLVSVIIPTYNREKSLPRAVRSVLEQDYKLLEVIIVDDCSSDATEEVVNSFVDDRIHYYRLGKNMGAAYARNYGVSISKGRFVAFQDSDDVWHPTKLQKQMYEMRRMSSSNAMIFTSLMADYVGQVVPKSEFSLARADFHQRLLEGNFISTQTVLCGRDAFDAIGGFDESLPALEDWDFAIRFSRKFEIKHLHEPLVEVHISGNSLTRNDAKLLNTMYLLIAKYKNSLSHDTLAKWYYNASVNALRAGYYSDYIKLLRIIIKSRTRYSYKAGIKLLRFILLYR